MKFELSFTDQAASDFQELEQNSGLHTHKYTAIKGANGEEIFEAYVENNIKSGELVYK